MSASSRPPQPRVLVGRQSQVHTTLTLSYCVVQQLPILGGLPGFSAARQLSDFSLIFKGQRLWEWCLETRLQERDMPNVEPNELHEDSVVRFGVPAHAASVGEQKEKVIHRVPAKPNFTGPAPFKRNSPTMRVFHGADWQTGRTVGSTGAYRRRPRALWQPVLLTSARHEARTGQERLIGNSDTPVPRKGLPAPAAGGRRLRGIRLISAEGTKSAKPTQASYPGVVFELRGTDNQLDKVPVTLSLASNRLERSGLRGPGIIAGSTPALASPQKYLSRSGYRRIPIT